MLDVSDSTRSRGLAWSPNAVGSLEGAWTRRRSTTPSSLSTPNRRKVDGYTIVEDAIDPALCDEIADDLLRLEHALGIVPADNSFEGNRTTRIYNLLVHGPLYERIPVHPNVLPIVEQVLDPGLLISSLSSISIGSDEDAQPIHSDDQLIPLAETTPTDHLQHDVGDHGLHRSATAQPALYPAPTSPTSRQTCAEHYDSIPAEMPKGSVLVWVGSLWHGGGANLTDERRVGIAMNYCAGFIRQQENQQLGIPQAHRSALPTATPGARRLLDLQRVDRAHRQAAPRKVASRDG